MYIISKFKDYYDGAVGMGIDKTIVYQRHLEEFKENELALDILGKDSEYDWNRNRYIKGLKDLKPKKKNTTAHTFLIGFCGKIYIGFKFITKKKYSGGIVTLEKEEVEYHYDIEKVKSLINFDKEVKYAWDGNTDLLKFNNVVSDINSIDPIEIFRKYNTPTFILHYNGTLEINTKLKDVNFYKVFETYSAFQEVQMFISGVLGTNEDGHDTAMTEKEKVQQHGFDQKYGFRTRPKG